MKPLLFIIILCMFIITSACGKDPYTSTGQIIEKVFNHEGVEREYLLYLPEGTYKDAPLLFVFHGYTSTGKDMLDYADFRDLADEHDFVLCYPQGLKDYVGINHWNANLEISKVDDIGFIVNLAENLVEDYGLDKNRVFATGMSNGGFMSYSLALSASDTFRAIASVSGLMSGNDWDQRENASPMPILHIHGTEDQVVLVDGTMSTRGGWGGAPEVEKIIEFWAETNGCDDKLIIEISESVTATRYKKGLDNHEVWYYKVKGLGHEWPLKDLNADFSAVDLIWDFFSQYE